MDVRYKEMALMMKALGEESRVKIFDMLANGELCACKVLEDFDMTQPTLSYHMKILCDCGLVKGKRDGIWMKYTINKEAYDQLKGFIDHIEINHEVPNNCNNKGECK